MIESDANQLKKEQTHTHTKVWLKVCMPFYEFFIIC